MYKKAVVALLITLFLLFGVLEKEKGAPDLYFVDIEKASIRMVGDRTYNAYDVIWSGDSSHFIFHSDEGDCLSSTNAVEAGLFRTMNIKTIKIPEKNNISYYLRTRVFWLNKDGDISDKPDDHSDPFATFHKKTGEEKLLLANEVADQKIRDFADSDYFEAYVSNDGNQVIFRAEDYKVYHLDLNTGEGKFLFVGCNLNWSPNETKISYGVPNRAEASLIDDKESFDSFALDSYVYDFNTGQSFKVADFGIKSFFSFDDRYMVFHECAFMGLRGGYV